MTATSSFPYAKQAALELIASDCAAIWSGDEAVVVRGAMTKQVPRASVSIYGTTSSDSEWTQQGAERREERYALDLQVEVVLPGDAVSDCEAKAFELWSVVEDRFRGDNQREFLRTAMAATPEARRHPLYNAECVLVDVVPVLWDKGSTCTLLGEIRITGRQ